MFSLLLESVGIGHVEECGGNVDGNDLQANQSASSPAVDNLGLTGEVLAILVTEVSHCAPHSPKLSPNIPSPGQSDQFQFQFQFQASSSLLSL